MRAKADIQPTFLGLGKPYRGRLSEISPNIFNVLLKVDWICDITFRKVVWHILFMSCNLPILKINYDCHTTGWICVYADFVEELSLKNTCLCRTLSYKDNDLHANLGFKCSLQTMVSTLNRNSGNSVLHRQWFSP